MPNKNYQAGYRAEAREKEHWEQLGYWAFRSAGSRGPFDVIAINGSEVVLVQVKSFLRDRPTFRDARKYMADIPSGPAIRKLLVAYGPRIQGRLMNRIEYNLS